MLYCHAIEGDDGSLDRCRNIEAFNSEPKALFLSETETDRNTLAMGKIRGTLRMRSHIFVQRATTKYFSNSFVFQNEIEKEGLPRDSTPALGAGGPRFESGRPDQFIVYQRLATTALGVISIVDSTT